MKEFLETYLKISFDGQLTVREGLFAAIFLVICLLVLAIIGNLIKNAVIRSRQKKKAIFSNKKNRYKSRLGKKNIKY